MEPKIMNLITRQSQDAAVLGGLLDSQRGDRPWLDAQEFVYVPSGHDSALLRLLCRRGPADTAPTEVTLLVRCDLVETCYRGWPGEVAPRRRLLGILSRPPLLWRATFEVPLSVAEHPHALFALYADQRIAVALPAPRPSTPSPAVSSPTRIRHVRLHAVALVAGVAAAAAVSGGAIASTSTAASSLDTTASVITSTSVTASDAGADTTATTSTTPDTASTTPDTTSTTPDTISTTLDTMSTATETTSGASTTAPSSTTPAPSMSSAPADPSPGPVQTQVASPAVLPTGSSSTPGSPPSRPAPPTIRQVVTPLAPPRLSGSLHSVTYSGSRVHPGSRKVRRPSRAAAREPVEAAPKRPPHPADPAVHGGQPLLTPSAAPVAFDPFATGQIRRFEWIGASLDQPPAYLVAIYKAAGRRYHVPWQILAAINAIETDYGQNLNVSVAGAIGWMQFEPSTWFAYGVRVDGRGQPNPYDPKDAIFSAARYLAANGAPQHIREAIYAYNHALWYVDSVLWRAQLIGDRSLRSLGRRSEYALPLDARFMHTLGRTDDGVDIETAPDGAAVYSIAPGVVSAVASDPGGFGPHYPVILVTAGLLAGQYIYYGHVAASLVRVGDHVLAGQPIAVMGHTGDAASLGHGHIEIGFSDGSGDPLNHHSVVDAWTPAGDAMRHVLEAVRARSYPRTGSGPHRGPRPR